VVILGVVGVVIFNSISSTNLQNNKTNIRAANIIALTSAAEVIAATPFAPCSAGNPNPYTAMSATIAPVEIAAIYGITSKGIWSYCTNSYPSELAEIEGVAAVWPTTENSSRIQKIILREPTSGLFRSIFKSFDNKLGNYGLGGSFKTVILACYDSNQVSHCDTLPTTGLVTNITLDVGVTQTFKLAVVNPKNPANTILYFTTPGSSNLYSIPSIDTKINNDLFTILAPKFAADGTTKNAAARGNLDVEAFDAVTALQAAPISLGISVRIPPFLAVINNPALTLIQGINSGVLNPVSYSGGYDPYTFTNVSISALPSGITFNSTNGTFSGTPTALLSSPTTYAVKITDTTGDSVAGSFTIQVVDQLSITNAISGRTFYTGAPITAFNPFTPTGGVPSYTYSVQPTLPAGLSLNTTTGQISGTPSGVSDTKDYTVTVVDHKIDGYVGQSNSSTFSIRILAPLVATQSVATKVVATGSVMSSYIPVTASGGASPYSYSVAPALPGGLGINALTGAISGTPTTISAATTYTVTVKDSIDPTPNTATATFSLRVVGQLSIGTMITGKTVYTGSAITSFNANSSATGGITPYTYSISPALPAGLTLTAATGQISGTPTVELATTTFTLTIRDSATTGYVVQSDTGPFSLRILAPLVATQSVATKVVATGSAMSSYIPVTASGGVSPYSYSVAPSLPSGLSMDTVTGAISGTPTTISAATTYTVTVKDSIDPTPKTATFSLQVQGPLTISNVSPDVIFYVGVQATLTPFTTAGGATPYTYSISPALTGTGLSINTSTGIISGTPTAKSQLTAYTVTVKDASSVPASRSGTFNIRILDQLQVVSNGSFIFKVGTLVASTPTVTVSGGLIPYTYSISAGLPTGLSFNSTTGAISGTPTIKTSKAVSLTVTVNDSVPGKNNQGTAIISITVNP
jgi:hypothetical protein